jgi:cupin 2 domain-containing protein
MSGRRRQFDAEKTRLLKSCGLLKHRIGRKMETGHLYQNIPAELPDEMSACLAQSKSMKIERIVSRGHRSAPGFWYEQQDNEWVLLVKGEAELRFEKENRVVHLTEGMYVNIPAHEKHRVEWTREGVDTIWLAVFY